MVWPRLKLSKDNSIWHIEKIKEEDVDGRIGGKTVFKNG